MSNESQSSGFSRRKFLQGIGAGAVGAAVLPSVLKSEQPPADAHAHAGQMAISLTVNGVKHRLMVEPRTTLAELLRNQLRLTGTKIACNQAECGCCTVLLNGKAIYSCHFLAVEAHDADIITIEGLMSGEELHPVQQAFIDHDGLQCGFCTPGQIMAAHALLLENPKPTPAQVQQGMSGNLCRCAAYPNILASVMAAAEKYSQKG